MKELSGAVAKLPLLTKQEAWIFSQLPKSIDDANGCTKVAQLSGRLVHSDALPGTQQVLESGETADREMVENTRKTANNRAKHANGPTQIRTVNQGIMSPMSQCSKA